MTQQSFTVSEIAELTGDSEDLVRSRFKGGSLRNIGSPTKMMASRENIIEIWGDIFPKEKTAQDTAETPEIKQLKEDIAKKGLLIDQANKDAELKRLTNGFKTVDEWLKTINDKQKLADDLMTKAITQKRENEESINQMKQTVYDAEESERKMKAECDARERNLAQRESVASSREAKIRAFEEAKTEADRQFAIETDIFNSNKQFLPSRIKSLGNAIINGGRFLQINGYIKYGTQICEACDALNGKMALTEYIVAISPTVIGLAGKLQNTPNGGNLMNKLFNDLDWFEKICNIDDGRNPDNPKFNDGKGKVGSGRKVKEEALQGFTTS